MKNQVSKGISMSVQTVKDVFKRQIGLYLKFVLFSLTAIVGKLTIIAFPLFALAEFRLANEIDSEKTVHLNQSFFDSKSLHKYATALLYALLKGTMMLTVLLIIAGLYSGLYLMGVEIDDFLLLDRYYSVMIVQIGCGVLLFISLLAIQVYFSPVMYLISVNSDAGLSEVLRQNNHMMMKNSGFFKLLLIWFYFLLRYLVSVVFAGVIGYVAYQYFYYHFFILTIILLAILLLMILPRILLMNRMSSIKLFEVMLENASYASLFDGEASTPFVERIRKEDVLSALFDEVIVETPNDDVETDEKEVK